MARVPRRLKSPECSRPSILPANRFLTAEPASSFRITATLSLRVSPPSLPLSLSTSGVLLSRRAWYRVCQNCSGPTVCTYDFNAPGELADPDRRFLVTSKLQAIAEKKRGGSDVSELRRDYGRRNIVDRRCSRANRVVASPMLKRARCKSVRKVRRVTV